MVSSPTVIGTDVWWQQEIPAEGGRTTVMHSSGGTPTALLAAPWNARTRVHEYGGRSYLPIPRAALAGQDGKTGQDGRTGQDGKKDQDGKKGAAADQKRGKRTADEAAASGYQILFANYADQRLYLTGPDGAEPSPLTPDPAAVPAGDTAANDGVATDSAATDSAATAGAGTRGEATLPAAGLRYADYVLSPDRREVWCVQERHSAGKVTRAIVAVPLDGSAADKPEAIRTLAEGFDFFAFPAPSPDGKWLAWICWNHPHMPWDGTELRVAPIEKDLPAKGRPLMGGQRESVLAPLWRDNSSLYVATDWPGWWNIYQVGVAGEPPLALFPADEEFAGPLWRLGARPFAVLGDGRLAVAHGAGPARLGILDPESFELKDLDTPFTEVAFDLSADGGSVAVIGGSPTTWPAVVRVDAATSQTEVLTEPAELAERAYLPVPQEVDFEGPYGQIVHALLYQPTNPDAAGPAGERPPFVVRVHGGPTSRATAVLDLAKAYFASRGIGIIDVNYGGSTGYGRRYRERLRREWGIVDVQDAIAAARWVAESAGADPNRLAIRGGSAGGWTTLAAVTTGTKRGRVFSAAVSYYGVSDLRDFAATTHDFESRYLDNLIGPLPGFEVTYIERAPVGHVTDETCPILLLQGLDDPVVPSAQAESIAADLAAHGTPYAYIAFEGESHGFRKAETVAAALEAELSFYGQILGFNPPGIQKIEVITPQAGQKQ